VRPDFDTPKPELKPAKRALDEGGPITGRPPAIRIARQATATRQPAPVESKPPLNRSASCGGKPDIFFPMLALAEPATKWSTRNPGFSQYESMIRSRRGPVPCPCLEHAILLDWNIPPRQPEPDRPNC